MKLISKLALLFAFHQSSAVDTGVQQLRGGEEDTFQQQLLGLKESVPPERSHDLSPGWQKNPSERQGEGHAGRRFHARKGRSNDTPRPERKVQPSLTTTSSSLAPQYCTQPEGGCILRYNNRTWNENGSECEGSCFCNYVNQKNRSRNGGQPAFMCSRSPGDDVSLPEDDESGVPDELYETATAATPTTTKASKEEAREARKAEREARKAEREANRGSKSTKSPSMEREEDELTETATTAAPTTTKASKEEAKEARKAEREARKAEREANRGSKSTKSPSQMTAFAIA